MWVGGWVGQPKSRGANLTFPPPPPRVSLSKGLFRAGQGTGPAPRTSRVQVQVSPCVVLLDTTLCSLVLDNAISNAFRHATSPDSPVNLAVTTAPIGNGELRLVFVLTNQVSPAKAPLTREFLARVWAGTHCRPGPAASATSDGIGLRQAFLAADQHDMALDLVQHGTEVRFTARVIVSVADYPAPPQPTDPRPFPPDLHVCVIDDSEQSRRMLAQYLRRRVTANVHVFGESVRDVEPFVEQTLAVADVAVLDQHLQYGAEESVLGTDLIQRLVARQFPGLLCVRSGNATAEDAAFYRRCGAHCVFGKDVPLRRMIEGLKVAYLAHASASGALGLHSRRSSCFTATVALHDNPPPLPGVPAAAPPGN